VFADESVHTLADIGLLAGRVDGVNLKIMKTGGVREMQRMIHAARAHGMNVMLGSMVESSLALSAAAQLAPLVDYLDLDGHWLVQHDPFDGAPRERGEIRLNDLPGLGVQPAGAHEPRDGHPGPKAGAPRPLKAGHGR
jgi:L-alanine-DL-glutamate epimerase-like enolase superfamily enzyme